MKNRLILYIVLTAGLLLLSACGIPTAPPAQPTATEEPFEIVTETQAEAGTFDLAISIDPFPEGNVFTSTGPVWINGTVDRMPFEKNLTYEVWDANGVMIQQGPVTVAGEYGTPGTFTFKVDFEPGQTGDYTIRLVNYSAEDGSPQGTAEVNITLQ